MSAPTQGPSSLRVLMTADAVGGVWQYALDVAAGLRQHGVETVLAVLGPAPTVDQLDAARAAGAEVMITGLPLEWTAGTPGEVEEAGRTVARIAAEIRPDLIHLNNPALAASAEFECPIVAVCHSCVATWWSAVRSGPLPDEFVWRTNLVREGYRAADRLLAPTSAFAQATARAYDLAAAPAAVHNGRRALPGRRAPSRGIFAFTAGRLWDDGKNVAAIDRAAGRLSLPVLAAGPLRGPNGAQTEIRHASALGQISDDEIAAYLSARPIFVSAAKYEPFGLAVLEAAQMGCALVLSDIPTFRELWDGVALFVSPDDDHALAEAIDHLATDAEVRRRWGETARERSLAYTQEAMIAGILRAYGSLIPLQASQQPVKGAAA